MENNTNKLSIRESIALTLLPESKRQAVEALLLGEEQVKLMEAMLKDGETKIEAEAFEEGQSVFVVTEEAEKIPAPEGEHTLEDGRVLVVDDKGMITEVKEAQAEEAPEAEEEEMSTAMADLAKRLEALEAKLSEVDTAKTEAEAKLSETEAALETMRQEVEKLSEQPSEEAPTIAPVSHTQTVQLSEAEEHRLISQMSPVERVRYQLSKQQN